MTRDNAFSVPASLHWLEEREDGRKWLKSLPNLLETAQNHFELLPDGQPFSGGNVSCVLPVKQRGQEAVLKLQFIDRTSRCEADALKCWNGNGAVRLLDHAPDLGALLLERCRPGRFLAEDGQADALGVLTGLLRKLLVPANDPFTPLADEAAHWLETLEADWRKAGKPCEKRLLDATISALTDVSKEDTQKVLLHQDLHGHNILSAERAPWLVIDPKPLAGDPAFALSPIVRSAELGHSRKAALYRLDRLSEELELNRERARLWTIGQTMAWSFSSPNAERHFETARWLLD